MSTERVGGGVAAEFSIDRIPSGEPWNDNGYLVCDRVAQEQIVIDPGAPSATIIESAEKIGVAVTAVVLTHAHHDHVRAGEKVARHFKVSCHIHSADFALLRKAPMYAVVFGGRPFPAISNPVALEAAALLPFGRGAMSVLHTPGHTPGSCTLLFPGFCITGDTLLNRRIGRTDLPGCSREALVASVDALLAGLDDDVVLHAGHREPWTAGEARLWWRDARGNPPALTEFEPAGAPSSTQQLHGM